MARKLFFTFLAANILFLAWSRWIAPDGFLPVTALQGDAATVARAPSAPAPPSTTQTAAACTSLGPFPNAEAQSKAAALLGAAGKSPRPRTGTLQVNDGYWVFVSDRRTASDPQATLAAIRRAGIDDAYVVPDGAGLRIAVGMFHERAGAEQRAAQVRAIQMEALIEEHTRTEPGFWLDVPGETRETLSTTQREQWGIKPEGLLTATCP